MTTELAATNPPARTCTQNIGPSRQRGSADRHFVRGLQAGGRDALEDATSGPRRGGGRLFGDLAAFGPEWSFGALSDTEDAQIAA